MAAPGATPIIIYHSTTALAQPSTTNVAVGELAINVTDGKVYSKNGVGSLITLVGTLGNQNANAVAITGGTISGVTITSSTIGNISGNAATATTLQTARLIGGVSFNGSANINLPGVNTTGNQNTTGTASNVTGIVATANGGTGTTATTGTGANVFAVSPTFTGTPLAPTASPGTNTTQIATTQFVTSAVGAATAGVSSFSAGTTGLTPSTGTTGAVTLGGTLAVANGGTGVTTSTGTGAVVRAVSPTLTTPNLGTPSAATLTNATGLPIVAGTTGTLSVARGGTGATSLAAAGITTLSGTQTITGAKTFSTTITGSISGNAGTVTDGVYLTGTQTITGDKTFTGAFGIGTANPAAGFWAGYARSLSASNPAFVMDGTTSAGSICSAYFGGAGGGDTVLFGQFLYGSQLSNTVVGSIGSTGTTTVYATTSDRRLKKDIIPMTDGLAKTMQLKPVDYVWVVNNEPSQGFIADELQQVIPEAVIGNPTDVNPDGSPKYQGIDTSFIVATLTNAIQQQQALIEALTSRVAALEAL